MPMLCNQMFACNLRSMKLPLRHIRKSTPASTATASSFISVNASVSTPMSLLASVSASSKPVNRYVCSKVSEMKMLTRGVCCNGLLQSQRGSAVRREHSKKICGSEISNFIQHLLICGLLLLLTAGNVIVEGAVRNVNLIIEPPAVRRGQHAIVRCLYDLDGTPLYSAKFYRGQLEFYRYTPGEFPNTKVFPFPGIHVDVTNSNATQVLIRNVGFGLSGNFSCEVTADAPLFSTATAAGIMQVVELPEKRPQLFTEHPRYEPGDVLRANCSTPPSRPGAELKFTINNMEVGNSETQYIRTIDNLMASRISLKLQLQGIHFSNTHPSHLHNSGIGYGGYNSGNNNNNNNNGYGINSVHSFGIGGSVSGGVGGNVGSLILRCTAQIGDLYQEYKEIELGTPQKDPIPARVTLSSSSSMSNFFSSYFSSSSRKFSPPTITGIILVTMTSIAITTITTTTLTSQNIMTVGVIVDLCIVAFTFFERMMKCLQKKLSAHYVVRQKANINKQEKQQQKRNEIWWQNVLPNRLQQQNNEKQPQQQQQQQKPMHAITSYYNVNVPTLTQR